MAGTGATASQAWAILKRHGRDEISPLRLQELCRDNDRVSSLVSVYNSSPNRMLVLDLSRQRMTLETLNHLLRLASAKGLRKYITRLAWGENDPDSPAVPSRIRQKDNSKDHHRRPRFVSTEKQSEEEIPISSFYLSLRVPKGSEMLRADGSNALKGIHRDWDRIKRTSDSIRRGYLSGVTGAMIRDVVIVGRGVPVMALRFIYLALCKDEAATIGRKMGLNDNRLRGGGAMRGIRFLTSVDPVRAAGVLGALDPASTMVINIALQGNEETKIATDTLKMWLLQSLGKGRSPEVVFGKHMMMVTGNRKAATDFKSESKFIIPENLRSEPFSTFTAATLMPLSIVFGWSIVKQLLVGAHVMDRHFVETNPRHNVPILLALTDIWNETLSNTDGRIISPFAEAFAAFPAFCATLEAQTGVNGMVVDGGLHHSYDKALYQADRVLPSELVMTMDSQTTFNTSPTDGLSTMTDEVHAAQDMLICSVFAHADELAFGKDSKGTETLANHISREATRKASNEGVTDGNRPNTLLICDRCDAFACGQLVALAEHRAVVKARILDIDPFEKEIGSSLRVKRTKVLKEGLDKMFLKLSDGDELDEEGLEITDGGQPVNISTRTILRHYANLMQDQRMHVTR